MAKTIDTIPEPFPSTLRSGIRQDADGTLGAFRYRFDAVEADRIGGGEKNRWEDARSKEMVFHEFVMHCSLLLHDGLNRRVFMGIPDRP